MSESIAGETGYEGPVMTNRDMTMAREACGCAICEQDFAPIKDCSKRYQIAGMLAANRERYAKKIEDHIIYTGPGGFDPEPIQKILAEMVRADG